VLIGLELTRSVFAGGRTFGAAGEYEQLAGRAAFALAPRHPANQAIVDLDLALPDAAGRVRFTADLRILQPIDPRRGNRRMVLDVVNRGSPVAIRNTEFGATRLPEADSAGWLLQQGFTVVSVGWQHNVPAGTPRLGLQAPEALAGGRRLTGRVRSVVQVSTPTQTIGVADEPSGVEHVAYPAANVDDPGATLTETDSPLGSRRVIPRDRWRFTPDCTHVHFPGGFQPGKLYELLYTAEGAAVTGLGFAALRDTAACLRFSSAAADNPCAGRLDHTLAFGGSQTGRLLRHLLYLGFDLDEEGRLVLDGVLTLIAGPLRTEANWRFGQPSFIGSDSPGFAFPFTDAMQTDPLTGRIDGLLERPGQRRTALPRIMHINTSAEYCNLSAALIHLTADGRADAPIPDNVRIYHLTGTHHGGGTLPLDNRLFDARAAYYNNSIDYRPLVRAAFHNLDAWVTAGTSPPASRYPRLADGTLVARETVRALAARLPGPGMPVERLYPTQRLDYGPSSSVGRASFPPADGGSYPDLVPAVDADGNERGGVRHPDVAVPLGTFTGWNPRHPSIGGPELNLLLNGATIPFARTAAQRERVGDQRLSIEERYPSRDIYLQQVRDSAEDLVREGYLLAADVDGVATAASRRYDEFVRLDSIVPGATPGV